MSLSNAVTNPMKSHVDRFGTFLLDRIRGYTDSTGVVAHKDGGRLGMPDVGLSKSRHFQLTQVRTRLDTIYERL